MAATVRQIQEHFDNQRYYEALQLYQTLYSRSIGKAAKREFLLDTLTAGVLTMLEAQEHNCAIELLVLVGNTYEKANTPVCEASVARLCDLLQAFPAERLGDNKLAGAVKAFATWSKSADCEHGDPALHNVCARKFREAGNLAAAHSHCLRGSDPELHTAITRDWAAAVPATEADLVHARAVLQTLCFNRLFAASELHAAAVSANEGEPSPLLNACGFVVAAELRRRYAKSFARESALGQYLDHIGTLYFGLRPSASANGNNIFAMLQNMMNRPRSAE